MAVWKFLLCRMWLVVEQALCIEPVRVVQIRSARQWLATDKWGLVVEIALRREPVRVVRVYSARRRLTVDRCDLWLASQKSTFSESWNFSWIMNCYFLSHEFCFWIMNLSIQSWIFFSLLNPESAFFRIMNLLFPVINPNIQSWFFSESWISLRSHDTFFSQSWIGFFSNHDFFFQS